MNEGKTNLNHRKTKILWRWGKVLIVLIAIWTMFQTKINLNPPLEKLAEYNVTAKEANAYILSGKLADLLPYIIQGVKNGHKDAHYELAEYYERGYPPFHRDECSAFDHYVVAGRLGQTDAQLKVAAMLAHGSGGYKDMTLGYIWASYAGRQGNKSASSTVNVFFEQLPKDHQMKLDKKFHDWSPTTDEEFPPTYRLPVIPGLWRIMKLFIPMRFCGDPTIMEHLSK